jgi:PRC-barrel domain
MTEMTYAYDWRGRAAIGADGGKIGTIDELYTDSDSGAPEWATVSTGLFGTKMSFVPLQGAAPEGESVRVQVSKHQVKEAPRVDPDGELSQEEEARLYDHYGMSYSERRSESGLPETGAGAGGVAVDRGRDAVLPHTAHRRSSPSAFGFPPPRPAGAWRDRRFR